MSRRILSGLKFTASCIFLYLLITALANSIALAQIAQPICDVGCGGSSDPSTLLQAQVSPQSARGSGSLIVAAQAISKSVAIKGSQSFTYVVPLLNLPGRNGVNADLNLYYNSLVWTATDESFFRGTRHTLNFNVDHDTPSYGFKLDFGFVAIDQENGDGVLADSTGAKHALAIDSSNTSRYVSTDSTYIEFILPSPAGAQIGVATLKDGSHRLYTPFGDGTLWRPYAIEDTNGNFFGISYVNKQDLLISSIVDTVGRVINFTYDATGTMLQSVSDGVRTVQFSWDTNYVMRFNFSGFVGSKLVSGQTVLNVLTGVTRPDGTSVVFRYGDWGIVKEIDELSSAGITRYSTAYNFPLASAGQLSANPGYTDQTSFDGVNSGTWHYDVVRDAKNNVTSFAVTTPVTASQHSITTTTTFSTDSLHLPIQDQTSVGTTVLGTTKLSWITDANTQRNPRLTTRLSILEDGVTQAQNKIASYDPNGNATDILEYGFGSGGPGPLLRETTMSFAAIGGHILNRPAQVITKDGSGRILFRKDFRYDEKPVTPLIGLPAGRDGSFSSSNNVRGNLTSVVAYTDAATPGGAITTLLTYDDAGNVIAVDSGCCTHQTTNYSMNTQYAFPDSIAVGPAGQQLVDSFTYNLVLGTPFTITDANQQTTQFAYEPATGRLSLATTPEELLTTTEYDDGAQIAATVEVDSALPRAMVRQRDGLGRPISTQLIDEGDPATVVANTSDAYNVVGQLLRESTPFAQGEDPLYTTFTYDDVGRVTSITPPAVDAASSQNAFQAGYGFSSINDLNGTQVRVAIVTSTDAAGNAVKHYTDALGRLLRVDEPGGMVPGAAATGSLTINGTLQSTAVGGSPAKGSSGSITINSVTPNDQSTQVVSTPGSKAQATITVGGRDWSRTICILMKCSTTFFSGTLTLNVNGTPVASASYSHFITPAQVADSFAASFTSSVVTVSHQPGSTTLTLTAAAVGQAGNYSFSISGGIAPGDSISGGYTFLSSTGTNSLAGGTDPVFKTVYDAGTVSVTVNGHSNQVSFGQNDTVATIAGNLMAAINGDTGAFVNASLSGTTLNLTSRTVGSATNALLSSSFTYDTSDFSSPNFTTSTSGTNLSGGTDAVGGTPVYDAGTVTLTIAGFSAAASYDQTTNNTSTQIASALVTSLNGPTSPVKATASDSTIHLTFKTIGNAGNVPVAAISTTQQGAFFSAPSFNSSGTNLSGGMNPNPGSLSTPSITLYAYDALGNLLQVQEGEQSRRYTYDGLSRLTSESAPETVNAAVTYSYTDFGKLHERKSPKLAPSGKPLTTTYRYDALNRLIDIQYNDGTPEVKFDFGLPGATDNSAGRLVSATDGTGTKSYSYDIMGRLTNVVQTLAGQSYATGYGYSNGVLRSMTYPSGTVVNFGHDDVGRISSISAAGQTIASINSRNAAGQLLNITYGNGMQGLYGYNSQQQLASIKVMGLSDAIMDLAYDYGAPADNGQIAGITDHVNPARSTEYLYDGLQRLSIAGTVDQSAADTWNLSYAYDRYGNRLSQTPVGGAGSSPADLETVDPATNRLTGTAYQYDAAGNVTRDPFHSYTYDAENRINAVDAVYGFGYDSDGLRVSSGPSNAGGRSYIYASGKVIAEYDNGAPFDSPTTEYIYLGNSLIASLAGGITTFHYSDHLSDRVDADGSSNAIRTFGHFPFGETWYETGVPSRWKFTSYERDSVESGLDYAQARFDSTTLGRFLSQDPLPGSVLDPQSLNRYAYTSNDPVNNTDPLGLSANTEASPTNNCPFGALSCVSWRPGLADQLLSEIFRSYRTNGVPLPGFPLDTDQRIARARAVINQILAGNNPCSALFNQAAKDNFNMSAQSLFNSLTFSQNNNPTTPTAALGSNEGAGPGATIEVFPLFSANSVQLNPNPGGPAILFNRAGPYLASSFQGNVLEIFHELAHITNILPPDGPSSMSPGLSNFNTTNLLGACQDAIDNASK